MKKLKVWVYIRVSTTEQAKNGYWKDLQLTKIKKYIEYNFDKGFEFNENLVYKDLWLSWAKSENERPWLAKLREDIKKNKVDVVVVYKLDRLARKTTVLLDMVEFFNIYNVSFVSTIENIDTSSATWKFFLTVLWAIAEMERINISERAIAWALEWVKKWFFSTWWSPIYWFKKNQKTKMLEMVDDEAQTIKYIFDLYVNEEKSLSEIARLLTAKKILPKFDKDWSKRKNLKNYWVWNATNISSIISNEAYIGLYWLNKTKNNEYIWENQNGKEVKMVKRWERNKDEWISIEVENIVENEIFEKAQKKLVENKYRNNNKNKPIINHLFSPLIKCWECWSRFKWEKWKPDKDGNLRHYYRCSKTNPAKYWENRCTNSQIRESELKENIYRELNRYFKNPDLILKKFLNKTKEDNSIKKYQKELIKNSENIETSYEKIAHFIDKVSEESDKKIASIYEKKIEDNKANIKILEERNEKLKDLIEANKEVIWNKDNFKKYLETYKGQDMFELSLEHQRKFISNMIKDITISKDDVVITFMFHENADDSDISGNKKDEHSQNENIRPVVSEMVQPAGIEPTTPRFAAWCSSNWATAARKVVLIYSKNRNKQIFR